MQSKIIESLSRSFSVGLISNMVYKQAFDGATVDDIAAFHAHDEAPIFKEIASEIGFEVPASDDKEMAIVEAEDTGATESPDTLIVQMPSPDILVEHLRSLGFQVTSIADIISNPPPVVAPVDIITPPVPVAPVDTVTVPASVAPVDTTGATQA